MKKLFLITFLAVFMLSCTDKKYDFENMSEDVHLFDNGVYFPLLTTDVPFSRMIEGNEDNIGLQADGIYFIHSNPGQRKPQSGKPGLSCKNRKQRQRLSFLGRYSPDAFIQRRHKRSKNKHTADKFRGCRYNEHIYSKRENTANRKHGIHPCRVSRNEQYISQDSSKNIG